MKTQRIEKLAEHLEALPRKLFNMTEYGYEDKCGTVCCALGHAGLLPAFRRAGLKTVPQRSKEALAEGLPQEYRVEYEGESGTEAGAAFFGISNDLAEDLFLPEGYPKNDGRPTPKQVAKRLRGLLRAQGKTATARA